MKKSKFHKLNSARNSGGLIGELRRASRRKGRLVKFKTKGGDFSYRRFDTVRK